MARKSAQSGRGGLGRSKHVRVKTARGRKSLRQDGFNVSSMTRLFVRHSGSDTEAVLHLRL